jgi:DtxR family Mn-dependent transcriptional regulator
MCDAGECVRFLQVVNQEPGFLRYLSESGFELGAVGTVIATNEDGGVINVSINDLPFTVGYDAANTIRVERVNSV